MLARYRIMVVVFLLLVPCALAASEGRAVFPAEAVWVLDSRSFIFRGRVMGVELRGTCVLEGHEEAQSADREAAIRARARLERALRDRGIMIEIIERLPDGRWLCRAWAGDDLQVSAVVSSPHAAAGSRR